MIISVFLNRKDIDKQLKDKRISPPLELILDTNIQYLINQALKSLITFDVICIHVNGCNNGEILSLAPSDFLDIPEN